MNGISSIAMSGLAAASNRLQASAARVADPSSNADPAGEAVQQIAAKLDVSANLQVIRTDLSMTRALLDVLA